MTLEHIRHFTEEYLSNPSTSDMILACAKEVVERLKMTPISRIDSDESRRYVGKASASKAPNPIQHLPEVQEGSC